MMNEALTFPGESTLSPQLNAPQQAAAQADGHVMVLAGAGTGKTQLLAERYLHHLQSTSPLGVVAVTYTERAAAELRVRIRTLAVQRGLDALTVAEIDAAPIGTIHALAAQVCRDHPHEAGVPDTFTVMDRVQAQQWRAQHLPRAVSGINRQILDHVTYSLLMDILGVLLDDPYTALSTFELLPNGPDLLDRARRTAWDELTRQSDWTAALAYLSGLQGPNQDRLEEVRRSVLEAMQWPPERQPEVTERINSINLTVGSKKAWGEAEMKAVKNALETLRGLVRGESLLHLRWNTEDERLVLARPVLQEAFTRIHEQLFQWRGRQRVLEFSDLEGCALKALTHPGVQQYYTSRFRAVLVDECQDTSPAQVRLLEAVSGGAIRTYVGDPLQSIYGFRTSAQPVYQELHGRVLSLGGTAFQLPQSHRTHQDLLSPLNRAMEELSGGQHQALSSDRPAPHAAPHLQFLQIETSGARASRLHAEAIALATEVRQLLDTQVPVHDRRLGTVRPIQPGDVAVLARTWKPLETYQAAFTAARIPAFLAGGGDLLSTTEAMDAWALLRAAGDPADDLAVAAILRGPLYRWSEAQLHGLWTSRLEHEPWSAALTRSVVPAHQPAREFFRQLHLLRRALPVKVLLLADRHGYRHQLAEARRTADWDATLQVVATLEAECSTPRAAAQRLRRLKAGGIKLPRPPIAGPDAVTLASIHHAKGMEWPVVIVADLDGRPPARMPSAMLSDAGVVFDLSNTAVLQPALVEYAARQQRRLVDQELNRLLYVACTRARDRLYAVGPAESTARAFTRLQTSFRKAGAVIVHCMTG